MLENLVWPRPGLLCKPSAFCSVQDVLAASKEAARLTAMQAAREVFIMGSSRGFLLRVLAKGA